MFCPWCNYPADPAHWLPPQECPALQFGPCEQCDSVAICEAGPDGAPQLRKPTLAEAAEIITLMKQHGAITLPPAPHGAN